MSQKPIIKRGGLSGPEKAAKYDCGCLTFSDGVNVPYLTFCPLHAAAPDMMGLIGEVAELPCPYDDLGPGKSSPKCRGRLSCAARALLAKIEGA